MPLRTKRQGRLMKASVVTSTAQLLYAKQQGFAAYLSCPWPVSDTNRDKVTGSQDVFSPWKPKMALWQLAGSLRLGPMRPGLPRLVTRFRSERGW